MLLIFFEKNYFLLALGWGIINSIWQTGALWVLYKLIGSGKNVPAVFKYQLSTILLTISFCWFIVTGTQAYFTIRGYGYVSLIDINFQWTQFYQKFSNFFQFLSSVYLVILFLYTIQFSKRFQQLFTLKNKAFIKVPAETRIFVNETAVHIGITRKVTVWFSEKIEVPCVTGYFKPLILLPFSVLNNLSTIQAEAIILHELAHIKRNDYLVNLVQSIMELVLFFNPFAVLLGRAARNERENSCDDWVLNYQYNKHDYATALMLLEAQRQQHPLKLAMAATTNKKQLLARVKRLFVITPATSVSNWQRFTLTGLVLTLLLLFLCILPSVQTNQPVEYSFTKRPSKMLNNPREAFFTNNATVNTEEINAKKIINYQLATSDKLKNEQKRIIQKKVKEVEYAEALINEDLLKANKDLQNLAIQVVDNQELPEETYLIKVEEETSGSKEKKSYLLEYKNINGKSEVKPLIILNKTKTRMAVSNTKANKSKVAQAKIPSRKKITS